MDLSAILSSFFLLIISVFLLPTKWKWLGIEQSTTADLVVTNAFIYTSDPSLPFADSMAIRNRRILRIGNYSSLKELEGPGTEKLSLGGKVVLPGFIDSHVHFISGGLQMAQLDLHGVNTKDEFIKKVEVAVKSKKQGSWILGGGWNNDLWGGELPMASWIDDITPYNPVWLSRMDGHMGLANSLALNMAGITRDTKDPEGGTIVRTINEEPSGLLIDSAMKLLTPSIPEVSIDERREALVRASRYAFEKGVTTVVDLGRYFPGSSVEHSWHDFTDVYRWADSSGNMMIRELLEATGRVLSEWIYLGGVKAFFDGSLGSNSALFYEAYVDDPENYGLQVTDLDSLLNMTTLSDRSGLQVAIHAIGDRANDLILDMYKSVAFANGMRDRRLRIEHAQHLAHGAAARFGEQGIIASVQPEHLLYDADAAIRKLGEERAQNGSYLFNSLLSSNAQLAFGSDWPVVDIDPLCSIKAAMKRIPLSWAAPWIPSECLSLVDALHSHTISAARSCFLDHDLGSLSPGKLADFVILSTDSWDEFTKEASANIEATFVGGVRVYPPKDVI